MATQSLEGTLSINTLNNALVKTCQFKYVESMKTYFLNGLISEVNNVRMPTNGFFSDENPEYKQDLINLYNGTFGVFDYVNEIPESVKVSQGALLDSVHFGYDMATGTYALYTMNPGIFISDMALMPEKVLSQIFEKNRLGQLKCYRIDLEYVKMGEDSIITYKLVNHRKDIDDLDTVMLVPLIASMSLAVILNKFINSGVVLKTRQDIGGVTKVRCITHNQDVLKAFCDVPDAVTDSLKAEYFFFKAFFYAPVIGAPSTTAMVTNINFFNLEEIRKVKNTRELSSYGVQKAKDGVESLVTETLVKSKLLTLKENDPEEYLRILDRLPNLGTIIPLSFQENITAAQFSTYLHTIKRDALAKVVKVLDLEEAISNQRLLYTGCKPLENWAINTLVYALNNFICKIIIRKKDFTLSAITCTNNQALLMAMYGEDYFSKYESIGVRLSSALQEANTLGRSLEDALNAYGFKDLDPSELSSRANAILSENVNVSKSEAYEEAIYEAYDVKKKAKSESNNILVRTVNAYLTGKGSEEYYRSVDTNKIVSVLVFSN